MKKENKLSKFHDRYKLYHDIDSKGHISFWLAILTLTLSLPIHYLTKKYNLDITLFDRMGSLSLAFLLFSELRLNTKINEYNTKIFQHEFDFQKTVTGIIATHLNTLGESSIKLITYSIKSLSATQKDKDEADKATQKYHAFLQTMEINLNKKLAPILAKKLYLQDTEPHLSTIQDSIVFFIIVSTLLWGFGSLIY